MGIEEILNDWGCPEAVITSFKENLIEEEQLPSLTDEVLKELIPQVGPRLMVRKKISELLQPNIIEHRDCSFTTFSVGTSASSNMSDNMLINNNENNNNTNNIPELSKPVVIELTDNCEDLLTFLRATFDDFDLKTLLSTSPLGKSVLKYYSVYNKLDNTRRNRLVSIIVKHLYNHVVKTRLSPEDYNVLGAKIIGLFPTETLGVYYCPAVRKAEHPLKKSVMAKGKLVNQVRNILFRSGDTTGQRTNSVKRKDDTLEQQVPEADVESDAQQNGDIIWLQHNFEPWNKVIEKWKNTYKYRLSNKMKSVHEFFMYWPVLSDLRGHILINLDFEKLYPNSQIAFHLNWENFFNKVLNHKIHEIKDEIAQNLCKKLMEKSDEDEKFPLQLTILNYLLPPRGRTKKWKFSTLESIEGMILHVQNPGDIENRVEETRNKAFSKGQTVQPYLILEGDTLENIRTTYGIFDTIKYQFLSTTEAFDLLFKSYHALHIEYPPQSAHILQLIQNAVYCIKTKYDITYPENLDVLHFLQQ